MNIKLLAIFSLTTDHCPLLLPAAYYLLPTFRKLHFHQLIRLPNVSLQFLFTQLGGIFKQYPFVAGYVGGRDKAIRVGEFVKFFVCDFERNLERTLKAGYTEHFFSNAKTKIITPFDILGDTRQVQAKGADVFDIHQPIPLNRMEWQVKIAVL